MSTLPDGRRLLPDVQETHAVRLSLFEELATRDRFRNVVAQDLRPLWSGSRRSSDDSRLYVDLRPAVSDEGLGNYVDAVDRAARTFHLTKDGAVPDWVGNYIHRQVEPKSGERSPDGTSPTPQPPRPQSAWFENGALRLRIHPLYMFTGSEGDDGTVREWETIAGNDGYGDREWSDLRTKAVAQLDALLRDMRASYETNNLESDVSEFEGVPVTSFAPRNGASLAKRPETIRVWVDWLLKPTTTPERATKDRIRDLATMAGLDLPTKK